MRYLAIIPVLLLASAANAQTVGGVTAGATVGAANYPPGATPWSTGGTGTTAGAGVTSPTPAAGKFAYLCNISVTAGTATTAIDLAVVLTGLTGAASQQSYAELGAPATAAGVAGPTLTASFTPCLVSNTAAVAVGVSVGALGTGGANQVVAAAGYIQ